MKLACNSLVEVWGNMGNVDEQLTSYKEGFKPISEFMEPMKDSNDDYEEMMELYSSGNTKDKKKEKTTEKTIENITETFLNKIKKDLDDDNNDLILLVILGIFIIFVLDSLVKIKISFK